MRRAALKKAMVIFMTLVLVFSSNSTLLTPIIAYAAEQAAEQPVVAQADDAATTEVADTTEAVGDTTGENAANTSDAAEMPDNNGSAESSDTEGNGSASGDETSADTSAAEGDTAEAEGEASESESETQDDEQEVSALAEEGIDLQANVIPNGSTTISRSKVWYDNNDSDRPDASKSNGEDTEISAMGLFYREAGIDSPTLNPWVQLTSDSFTGLGMESVPAITVNNTGNGYATYSASGVPTSVTINNKSYNLEWKIDEVTDTTSANSKNKVKDIDYLRTYSGNTLANTKSKDVTFYVQDLDGGAKTAHENSNFTLYRQNGTNADGSAIWEPVYVTDADGNATGDKVVGTYAALADGDNIFTLTYSDLPEYDENNNKIVYSLLCDNEVPDATQYEDRDDWYKPTYQNADVANYGTETDRAYEGGTVQLLRTNMMQMSITKAWLDNEDAYQTRPSEDGNRTYQLYLWRYVNNGTNTYQDASQVLDGDGYPVGADLPSGEDGKYTDDEIVFSYKYTAGSVGETTYLNKYDAEGYEYVYLARETKPSSDGYVQVFGSVAADGTVSDTTPGGATRDANDKGIYNGGTISNRLNETTTVPGTKSWLAAAHQNYLKDYTVTMVLQESSDGGATWSNAKQNGVDVTVTLNDFTAELQTKNFSASMPKYDPLGKELTYQWVEQSVTEGASTTNLLETDTDGSVTGIAGKQYFETSHNTTTETGKDGQRQNIDWYASVVETDAETGELSVTNKLEGLIDYKVTKYWYDADGNLAEPDANGENQLQITLYQNGKPYQLEGVTDAEGHYTMTKAANGKDGTAENHSEQEGEWDYIFKDLPKYDENGNTYDYYVMETLSENSKYYPTYSYDEATRTLTLSNHIGIEGDVISVAKEWLDDSNTAYRPTVTYQVTGTYEKETTTTDKDGTQTVHAAGSDFTYTGTLNSADNWWELVSVTGVAQDSIKVFETKLTYNGTDYAVAYEDETDHTGGTVSTGADGYQYVVTNPTTHTKVDGYEKYIITNRRYGTVNIAITKNWTDGETAPSERAKAKLTLSCVEDANAVDTTANTVTLGALVKDQKITRGVFDPTTGYITANETAATAIQEVSTEDTSTYYFCNLPKYDDTGKIVHYEVTESWDDSVAGNAEKHVDYAVSYGQNYQTFNTEAHTNDAQSVEVKNYRAGTKSIAINKTWDDVYQYQQGHRPDIKYTVWQRSHVKTADGTVVVNVTKYNGTGFKDYLYSPRSGVSADRQAYELTADFGTAPKYDSLGYEIEYFFEESVPSNASTLYDYNKTTYQDADGTTVEASDDSSTDCFVYTNADGNDSEPHTLLVENGTFVNSISNSVLIEGTKIWQNVPDGFPAAQIPAIKVSVDQKVDGGTVSKGIATTTELKKADDSDRIYFYISHTGENTGAELTTKPTKPAATDDTAIQKYNAQGKLYTYVLNETYATGNDNTDAGSWTEVFETDAAEGSYTLKNIYNSSTTNQGSITVTKEWAGRGKINNTLDLTNSNYPLATFTLYRQYATTKDGGDYNSTPEKVASKTLNANTASSSSVTFDALPVYAPNGQAYRYYVVESNINGQTIAWANGEDDHSPYIKLNSASDKTASVTATNTYAEDDSVDLKVVKSWNDGEDAAGVRPTSIQVKIYMSADSQPGANNAIAETQYGGENMVFTMQAASDGTWKLETTGINKKGTLPKWAPNGMPWRYRVEEVGTPEGYTTSYSNNRVAANSSNTQVTITNSYTQSVNYTKTWEDSNNAFDTRPAYLKVKLQVAKSTTQITDLSTIDEQSNDGWHDANNAPELDEKLKKYLCKQFTNNESQCQKFISGTTAAASNLPSEAKIGDTKYYLYYRIVEDVTWDNNTAYPCGSTDGTSQNESWWRSYKRTAHTTTQSGNTSHTAETNTLDTTSLTVTKNWDDDENYFGKRTSVTVKLQYTTSTSDKPAESEWTDQTGSAAIVTLTEANSWSHTFTNLPKYDAEGKRLKWRAVEGSTPADYQSSGNVWVDNGDDVESGSVFTSTVTNSLNKSAFAIEKKGEDADNALSGAGFDVYNADSNGNQTGANLFTWTSGANGGTLSEVATYGSAATPVVSMSNGKISGLPEGTYVFVEQTSDFNPLYKQQLKFTVTIDASGALTSVKLTSANNTGSVSMSTDKATITATDALAKTSVTVTKYLDNKGTKEKLANVEFDLYKMDGSDWTKQNTASLTTDANGQITLSDLGVGQYYLVETKVPDNTVKSAAKYYFDVVNANGGIVVEDETNKLASGMTIGSDKASLAIVNDLFGARIKFDKLDATSKEKIAGATFQLYHKGDGATSYTVWGSPITSTDGSYSASGLEKGDYKLVETVTPRGYTTTPINDNDGNPMYVDNKPVVMAFTVTIGENDEVVDIYYSDVTNKANWVDNERMLGSVVLTKVDADNDETKLADAKFKLQVKGSDGSWSDVKVDYSGDTAGSEGISAVEYTTDANGQISLKNLPWATYRFVETSAKDGYLVGTTGAETTSEEFTVEANTVAKEDGSASTISLTNVTNKQTSVSFNKVDDSADGKAVSGAHLKITYSEGGETKTFAEWDSSADAKELKGFVVGTEYTFSETTTPAAYLTASPITFKVDSEGTLLVKNSAGEFEKKDTASISMTDTVVKANIALKKTVDGKENNTLAKGTKFDLYKSTDGGKIYTKQGSYTIDDTGTLSAANLEVGKYYFIETSTPAGVELNTEKVEFEVTHGTSGEAVTVTQGGKALTAENGTYNLTKNNNAYKSSITWTKVDADNNDATITSAATFELKNTTTNKTYTVTNNNGVYSAEVTEKGTYVLTETAAPTGYEDVATGGTVVARFELVDADHGKILVLKKDAKTTGGNKDITYGGSWSENGLQNTRKKGSLTILKVDDSTDGKALAGAVFTLTGPNNYKQEVTTDSEGKATWTDLAWGSYMLTETTPATGHSNSGWADKTFTIGADHLTQAYQGDDKIINKRTVLSLNKIDDANSAVNDAVLTLKDADGVEVLTWTRANSTVSMEKKSTDAKYANLVLVNETNTIFGLPTGTYTLSETTTPDAYLTAANTTIAVAADGTVSSTGISATTSGTTVTVTDVRAKVDVKVKKSVAGGEGTVEGVTFELHKSTDDSLVATATTGVDGLATFEDIYVGSYYVIEVKVPADVVKSDAKTTVEVTNNGGQGGIVADVTDNTVSIVNQAYNANLSFKKVDSETGKVISGATFKLLYTAEGSTEQVELTDVIAESADEPGTYTATGLKKGTYVLFEVSAPDGYAEVKDLKLGEFTLDNSMADKTYTIEKAITNNPVLAEFSFTKTGKINESCANAEGVDPEATTPLEGVEFTLTQNTVANDNWKWDAPQVVKSDADGKVSFTKIPEGTYTLSESATVDNYDKLDTTWEITVDRAGNVTGAPAADAGVVNDHTRATFKFTKVSDVDGTTLAGAEYELYRMAENTGTSTQAEDNSSNESKGQLIATAVSDKNGVVEFDGLLNNYIYRVHESKEPAGSLRSADDITFSFDTDGNPQILSAGESDVDGEPYYTIKWDEESGTFKWYEPQTEYEFIKVDESGKALSGAVLQVLDADNNKIDEWTTDGTAHEIVGILVAGESYKLHEASAPSGYDLAADIIFTVENKTGHKDDQGNDVSPDAALPGRQHTVTITMTDTLTPPGQQQKRLAQTGDTTPGNMAIGLVAAAGIAFVSASRKLERKRKK